MPETGNKSEQGTLSRIGLDSLATPAVARATLVVASVLFLAYLFFDLVRALGFLLFLIIISIFLAYLLEPIVRFIRHPFVVRHLDRFMPRPLAIVVTYFIVFVFLGVTISYLAPLVAAQITEFIQDFPNYAFAVQARIDAINHSYTELMITEDVQKEINEYVSSSARNLTNQITSLVGSSAITVLSYLPWILLIPILSFFFLKDALVLRSLFLSCFPSGRWRARVDSILTDVNTTIAAYTRAQLISCILIGLVCTLAFTLIGLDYPLLLGLLAGVLEFIPLLGPLAIGITATLIGAFSDDPWQAAWTAGFLILLRLTHDYVTYPRIVREGIHLHPFAVVLSVLAGEQIAGIAGVFLSIPVIALLTVFHKHFLEHSGRAGIFSGLFQKSTDEPAPVTVEE